MFFLVEKNIIWELICYNLVDLDVISKNIIWIKNNIFSSKIILRYQHIKSTWLICQVYNPVYETMIIPFKVNENKLRCLILNQSNIEV
jgi:hypothetical protein